MDGRSDGRLHLNLPNNDTLDTKLSFKTSFDHVRDPQTQDWLSSALKDPWASSTLLDLRLIKFSTNMPNIVKFDTHRSKLDQVCGSPD